MNSKIRARLKTFVEGLSGPLGTVPLDRAIRANLSLFQILRASGATWPQIANALAAAGARRPDGSLISSDHVRSAVTRQLKRTSPTEAPQEPAATSGRNQPPRITKSTPDAAQIDPATLFLSDTTEIRPTRANGPSKDTGRSAAAGPPDGPKKLSIQEKLERTRRLRES